MATGLDPAPTRPAAPAAPRLGRAVPGPWAAALVVGLAVLLAATPVAAVVDGWAWLGYAAAAVALVAAVGVATAGLAGGLIVLAQLAGLLLLCTTLFSTDAVFGVLPGPAALGELAAFAGGAITQIQTIPAPVPASPQISFLVALAVGALAVAAHFAGVVARAPAAAGVPLLVVFAVPTALADDLLPWWCLVAAAGAFGLLLVLGGDRRRLAGAGAIVTAGIVLALLVGVLASAVGTDGRFAAAPHAGADIGLDPFAALRGELIRAVPEDLLEVRGLPRPTYLRALTLRDYLPDRGWEAGRPDPGVNLTGPLPVPAGPGEQATVEFGNIAFRDYWLPLYGDPLLVTGVDDEAWAYDSVSGIAFTSRPRAEDGWEQRASLPAPSAADLRAAGREGVDPAYLETGGVDARVYTTARDVTAGRTTDFDRTMALLDWFTAPGSPFRYSLQTAPGNGDDALVEFLTTGRVGYCEQFASAMAIMLRTLGVPARVAIGFTAGIPTDDRRTIRTADAHAWVEVWFSGLGWVTFDPTPLSDGRTVEPPYVREARDSAGAAGQPTAAQPTVQPVPTPPGKVPTDDGPDQSGSPAPGPAGIDIPIWPFVLVVVVGLLVATPASWRSLQRRQRLAVVTAGGPAAATAAWTELLAESADRGVPRQLSDTVRGTARRMVQEHHLGDDAQVSMRQVVGAIEASWYGEAHPTPRQLDAAVHGLRSGMETGHPLGWRRRLLPRSVLGRTHRR